MLIGYMLCQIMVAQPIISYSSIYFLVFQMPIAASKFKEESQNGTFSKLRKQNTTITQ